MRLPFLDINLVACKLFRASVVIIDSRLFDHGVETLHHLWRNRDVVDGRNCVFQIAQKQLLVDRANFAELKPMRLLHSGHATDELIVRILCFQSPQFIEKRSVLRPAVRVETDDSVRMLLPRRLKHHAAEKRDADAARQEYRRSLNLVMQGQVAGRSFDLYGGTCRHRF